MSQTITETQKVEPQVPATLTLQTPAPATEDEYRYSHLLPVFSQDTYPPLTPFSHSDPGLRALNHPNPRAFLSNATSVVELTPRLGTEVHGINLAELDSDARDELALEVARRGLVVFRDQHDFIDRGPDFYKQFGAHFGRLHVHPTSGHPAGYPELHLVYRDANSTFNFEVSDSTTSTVWHSDVSYELQPPGLTTFFLLAQPDVGGDTLFTSQVSTLQKLSPQFVAFLRTLTAAEFSRSGKRGGIVRREPVENEALYVNRQFTRRIVGLKKEESENILRFLYDHIDKSGDNQARLKWQPGTTHSAIRITPQAERPIPALDGLKLE
ncbi:hypothetical protein B0H14DRAFT_3088869 [Mycena olivaceomarginata]|nr:hypothetical protein B0H14DRAFT_3088869 [Mycena olivaceomarginata]